MKKHIHDLGIEVLDKIGAEIKHEIHDVESKIEATLKVTDNIYDKIHNLVEEYLKKNKLKLVYVQFEDSIKGGYIIKNKKEIGTAIFTISNNKVINNNEIIYSGRKY